MTEKRIDAGDGIELWSQDFGDPGDPAALLITGATTQGIIWPPPLIDMLVAQRRHVIRYDHRDVGQSTCRSYEAYPYTLDQLADDALAVLDGWQVETADVIGVSMGGMIAQLLMIKAPQRLISATLSSTTPLAGRLCCEDLPRGPFLLAMDKAGPQRPAATKQEWLDQQTNFMSALSDPQTLDTVLLRELLNQVYERANNIDTAIQHALAIEHSKPRDRRPLLANCTTRTTVIHGRKDSLLPLSHGQALASSIPAAKLIIFDQMVHDLPPYCWEAIASSVDHP